MKRAHSLRDSQDPSDNLEFLKFQGELKSTTFDYLRDARKFMNEMKEHQEFFCITDNEYRFIEQSDYCAKMRKDYEPLQYALNNFEQMTTLYQQMHQKWTKRRVFSFNSNPSLN